jgi:DNA-directed RNA polymerase I subunit RPA2
VCCLTASFALLPYLFGVSSVLEQNVKVVCRNCDSSKHCATVAMPYVFNYLANELAAMNIRLTLDVK